MPSAEIIAIGTELLLGEIQDTNTRYLALKLRDVGIDLFRATLVGDNAQRIAIAIQEALSRSEIVITTGGLGPTVDDPTRQAVALAFGVDTEFRPELWDQIQNRFQRFGRIATDNNKRQAFIPCGATAIENAVGTAPAFLFEQANKVVISLPGVPREMEYLWENKVAPYLRNHYDLHGTIKARVLHATGVGESQVDEWIGDLETLTNPTVGLLAHPGQIDIRVTAKAAQADEADAMLESVVNQIYARMGEHIFGEDKQTIESVLQQQLAKQAASLAVVECNMTGELIRRVSLCNPRAKRELGDPVSRDELVATLQKEMEQTQATYGLAASYQPGPERQTVTILVMQPTGLTELVRSYGGPPQQGLPYSINTTLDTLRRQLPNS